MIYVMSDLHGCYDKYKEMLKKINLNENDTMYILGDIVDRGDGGIKILIDMLNRKNVVPLLGNHDYVAFSVLKHLIKKPKPDWWDEIRADWVKDGGNVTEKAFMELDENEQKTVLNFITNFDVYETVKVGENKFLLSHAGIDNYENGKAFDEYELYDFIAGRMDYDKVYSEDFYLVSGHTPTELIDKNYAGRIYKKNKHIAIDCGAVFGYPLGCICLDNMQEFYVD